jgi:hypothetical protein
MTLSSKISDARCQSKAAACSARSNQIIFAVKENYGGCAIAAEASARERWRCADGRRRLRSRSCKCVHLPGDGLV